MFMNYTDEADRRLYAALQYHKVALRDAIEYEELAGRPTRQLEKKLRRVLREERRVAKAEKRRMRADCRELRIKVHTLEVLGRLEESRR